MDDAALRHRLDAIARRQTDVISLLVGGYVAAGLWVLVETVEAVTVWTAAVGLVALAVVASGIGIYRRRRARTGTGNTSR